MDKKWQKSRNIFKSLYVGITNNCFCNMWFWRLILANSPDSLWFAWFLRIKEQQHPGQKKRCAEINHRNTLANLCFRDCLIPCCGHSHSHALDGSEIPFTTTVWMYKTLEITGKTTYWLVNAGFVPSTVSYQPVFSRPVDIFFRSTGSRDWSTWIIWQDVSSEPKKKWTTLCYQNPALKFMSCTSCTELNFPHGKNWISYVSLVVSVDWNANGISTTPGGAAISEGTLEYPQRVRRAWSQLSKAMALEWVHGYGMQVGQGLKWATSQNPWMTWILIGS